MTETTLDAAHAAMEAAPEDASARLRFFERLADAELFLLLTEEAQGERVSPELFELADGRFVLAFDSAERLSRFTGRAAPYAALSGRVLASTLIEQGIGLGLNLDVAPSSMLLPPEALAWLTDTLGNAPDEVEAQLVGVHPPAGLPNELTQALESKLATAGRLAQAAFLVAVTYENGGRGHLLGFVGAVEGAQSALAKAVSEALTFSGIEAGALDVGFFADSEPMAKRLAKSGRPIELPEPEQPTRFTPAIPGGDPDKPPILK